MEKGKRVVIVGDHALLRHGVKTIIEGRSGFKVVGEAGCVKEGIVAAERHKPEVCLVDISLPDRSGFQFTREINRRLPCVKVVVFSMYSQIDYVAKAFRCGARGYVVKQSSPESLIQGLRRVAEGDYYLDSIISPSVMDVLAGSSPEERRVYDRAYLSLNAREQGIFKLMVEGIDSSEIAMEFSLSRKTVENHRASIMKKLRLSSIHQMLRYAFRIGLVDIAMWLNSN